MNFKQNIKAIILPILLLSIVGCDPKKEIIIDEITEDEIIYDSVEMVARNNEIRAELYQGHSILWDESLALSAQAHANYLALNNSFEHSNSNNGENLYASSLVTGYVTAINNWYSEKSDYNLDTKSCDSGKVCGHYTQLIWQETTEVGCGKSSSNSWTTIIVCQYNPPGNYLGEIPF